jgi:hypothetical protein
LVKANAALGSRAARALVAQLASVDEHVAALWRENPNPMEQAAAPESTSDPSAPPTPSTPVGPEVVADEGLHLATRADPPNGPRGAINSLVVSRTDPDAGLVARDGVPLGFYYKAHLGVDGGRQRIITAVEITPGEVADEYLLDRLLKEHVGTTHRQVEEVVADTKYGTHANYVRLEAAGIRATIPPHSAMRERGAYRADQFVYELATRSLSLPKRALLASPRLLTHCRSGGWNHLPWPAEGLWSLPSQERLLPNWRGAHDLPAG